jgi:hypothetical protein
LNSGTASFIECFRFPSSNERRNIANFRNTQNEVNNNVLTFFGNDSENGSTFSDPFEEDPIDWSLFEDENLLRFLSSPFNDYQMQSDGVFDPLFMDPNFTTADQMTSIQMPTEWEPPSPQSAAIVQSILDRATLLGVTLPEQEEYRQQLTYLFTPSRIDKFIAHYFEFWHPHCPILHQPSFSVEIAPIPLIVSVALMGAMYSQSDQEVNTAKQMMDLSELFVYSIDDLTDDSEVRQMLRSGSSSNQTVFTTPLVFPNLQAAYLMVCVQFWAGGALARKRAIETRFGTVIKVKTSLPSKDIADRNCQIARRLGIHKSRHEADDAMDEALWIQKESRIRYDL